MPSTRPSTPASTRRQDRAPSAGKPACPSPPAAARRGWPEPSAAPHLELARKIDGLPKDVAVALIGLGAFGIAIPGPIPPGASFVLLGIVFLRPSLLAKTAGPVARRCPRLFRFLGAFVDDLRIDLERRYPGSVVC